MQDIPLACVPLDDAPKPSHDVIEFYRRVMLDHTELLTRVARVEDRARCNSCSLLMLALLSAVLGAYIWVGHLTA